MLHQKPHGNLGGGGEGKRRIAPLAALPTPLTQRACTYLMRDPVLSAVCCRMRVPLKSMWFLSFLMLRCMRGSRSAMETWEEQEERSGQ